MTRFGFVTYKRGLGHGWQCPHHNFDKMSRPVADSTIDVPFRQIRIRQPTPDSVIVYQAYSAEIAEAAVTQQRLNASESFKMPRIAWIKASFFSCMYRAEWSYKDPSRARILQITMSKEGLLTLLKEAASSPGPDTAGALVRYKWDPEYGIRSERLPYRSLQLGIEDSMKERWINEWIIRIDDITEDVRRWKGYVDEGAKGVRKARREIEREWTEDVLEVDEQLAVSLGMLRVDKED